MKAITLVFPHQLFQHHPAIDPKRDVMLVEEDLYFNQFSFHKHKLFYHRATMQSYLHEVQEKGMQTAYIPAQEKQADIRKLVPELSRKGYTEIHIADLTDDWLSRRLKQAAKKTGIEIVEYESPMFLNTQDDLHTYFLNRKRYFMADFYTYQRKKRNILVSEDGDPEGGKWSFDEENRERFPKKEKAPEITFPAETEIHEEARSYVEKHYAKNYGEIPGEIRFPINSRQARAWLKQFFDHRFRDFGKYEDAIVASEHFLFHSQLTPMLNTGLLTPREIVDKSIEYADQNNIPLNSLEGFIRQVIGWREFIRGVYEIKGGRQRTRNFWKFNRKLPESFWKGTTGVEPMDIIIRKVLDTGYLHHIERLMIAGNFMLLCEIDPDDVYHWFMELFIDAYDWVMVPNVYGMSQFADGGLMATKPYISSSNYLVKMSDFKKGLWQEIWDGLFWRFMDKHRKFFEQNPRIGMLIKTFDKMPEEKQKAHLRVANAFLKTLDS